MLYNSVNETKRVTGSVMSRHWLVPTLRLLENTKLKFYSETTSAADCPVPTERLCWLESNVISPVMHNTALVVNVKLQDEDGPIQECQCLSVTFTGITLRHWTSKNGRPIAKYSVAVVASVSSCYCVSGAFCRFVVNADVHTSTVRLRLFRGCVEFSSKHNRWRQWSRWRSCAFTYDLSKHHGSTETAACWCHPAKEYCLKEK